MRIRHPVSLVLVNSVGFFLAIELLGTWSWPPWLAWALATLLLAAAVNAVICLYHRS